MSATDYAQTLLTMANKDLKALRNMTDPDLFDDEIFGFHAQQSQNPRQPSFSRRRGSRTNGNLWIPAFARMTKYEVHLKDLGYKSIVFTNLLRQ